MTATAPDLLSVNPRTEPEAVRELVKPFCVELIRALLHHSYYPPDHPNARQVAAQPFTLLKDLGRRWYEFTFARGAMDEHDGSIQLEAVFPEPVELEWVIGGTAGEHFARKLHDFCVRNRIVSFSVKNYITDTEFRRFVSVFVKANPEASVAREVRFTEQLLEADVYAVSVLLEADMVLGADMAKSRSRLPWRVRLALSRLSKDLRILPLFERADPEQLRATRLRTFEDVLRPLSDQPILLDFFANMDLIAESVQELADDAEVHLVRALPCEARIRVAHGLLELADRVSSAPAEHADRPRLAASLRRQLDAIGGCLCECDGWEHVELMRTLYARGHIPFEQLPEGVREQMEADRLLQWYEQDPNGFLGVLDGFRDAESYTRFLTELLVAFPRIVEARAYGPTSLIVDTLYEHRKGERGFASRRDIVAACVSDLGTPQARGLIEAMNRADAEQRRHLRRLFLAIGHGAIPALIEILEHARDPAVSEDVALALTGMGHAATARIRTAIVEQDLRPCALVHLFRVLEHLRDHAATRVIRRFLRHPAPEVRDAALEALAEIAREEAVQWLRSGLADPDPLVSRNAMRRLIHLSEPDAELASSLLSAVPSCGPVARRLRSREYAALEALGGLARCGNVTVGGGQTVEEALLQRLGERDAARPFGLFRRRHPMQDDAVRVAICRALAALGDVQTESRFGRWGLEPSIEVSQAMREGLQALESRLRAVG